MSNTNSEIDSAPEFSKFIKGMRKAIGLEPAGKEADECLEAFKKSMGELAYQD